MGDLWTSSRLAVVHRCLRLHHYRFGLGLGEPSNDTARFGTVGHAALEVGLLSYDQHESWRLNAGLTACNQLTDPYERARCRAVIAGYWARWGSEPWEVLAVEQEFRFLLGDVEIGGKIDALIRDTRTGEVFVLEHKFSALDTSPGSAYWERLTIDTQVSIYTDGAAMLGHGEIAGVIYDVIAKPQHEPALATPPDKRKLTRGKGCQLCGGKAGVAGDGKHRTNLGATCGACNGTGWRIGEEPRLYAGQRDASESPEDFEVRILAAIAEKPDQFYRRGTVVRLADELPKMRADILDTIKLARVADLFDIHPRNTSACAKFGSLCAFFDACAGRADITDESRFPRGRAHPELAASAA